ELRGPCSTLSAGGASGLAANAYAAHLLAHRDDADRIVAGGVEELGAASPPGSSEGASCAVLAAAPPGGRISSGLPGHHLPRIPRCADPEPRAWPDAPGSARSPLGGPRVRVAGWSIAAPRVPGGLDRAVCAALAMAGCTVRDVDVAVGPPLPALEVPHWIDPARLHGDAG